MYQKCIKRFMDFILASAALIALSPIILIIALMVRLKLGEPVIFRQLRPGKNEKIFEMYKFRTMTNERDCKGNLLSDEIRLTKFGKGLRDSSLDELPELLNILKGDMSIVGPRPQLIRDMVFMTSEQRHRHSIRPGLTGLAQIMGRNGISWEAKLKFDLEYIDKVSFYNDLVILIKTIGSVLKREGINTEGMATAEDFGDYLLRTGHITLKEYKEKQKVANTIIEQNKNN